MSKILFTGVSCLLAAALVVSAPTQKYVESQLVYSSGYLEAGRDRLLETHQFMLDEWPTPQNITFPIRFPQNGKKIIVTYVTAVSDQCSEKGHAYFKKGGIGSSDVIYVLEAWDTNCFNGIVEFYGHNQ